MSRSGVKEYRSLVWLRRVREKMAVEDAKGPSSRAVRERQRRVDALITKRDHPRSARLRQPTASCRPRA